MINKIKIFAPGEQRKWHDLSALAVPYLATPAIRRFAALMTAFTERGDKRTDHYKICASRLHNHLAGSGIRVLELPDKLMLEPTGTDGLAIYVFPGRHRTTVTFGGWYDDFTSLDAVLHFVHRAATGQIRLRIDLMNGRAFRWTVEAKDGENWSEANVMETAFGPQVCRSMISHYLQNTPQQN